MKIKSDSFKLRGEFLIETRNKKTGVVIDREERKNLIVTAGLVEVAKLLNNADSPAYFRAIAIGTGSTAAAAGDTTLGTEVVRAAATASYEATAKAVFEKTFEFESGESYAITEAAILNNSTSGGDMLNRVVFTAKNVDDDIACYVKFTITVSTT